MKSQSLIQDFFSYAKNFANFSKGDWTYYVSWVGLMMGLLVSVFGFLLIGYFNGIQYPAYVWNIPLGTVIFVAAIATDTIGHRTLYKEHLEEGEGFVHAITIFLGVSSVVLLCLAYSHRDFFRIPALVFIVMSIFYSVIDEWMHWKRYMDGNSGRIEMWSHVFIFMGHIIMIWAWWHWFEQGYPGVSETLQSFKVLL